ncbi:MAG: damage-control phosphatase ARMT1 family protein [Anaerolineaceae bacterium]|nr:damage-control phosphatase ARMT1 family protein [Anaerolineaceae bacterium]
MRIHILAAQNPFEMAWFASLIRFILEENWTAHTTMDSIPPTPSLPLPPPLRGADIPSFANYSIVVRLPEIARRVISENELLPAGEEAMRALIEDIPAGKMRPLQIPLAPDALEWLAYLQPVLGQDWLQIPWFFAENYFYERVLEACGYYCGGPGQGVDPYQYQKRSGLSAAREAACRLSDQANRLLHFGWNPDDLARVLKTDLQGNQVDLSIWPAGNGTPPDEHVLQSIQERILVDDTRRVADRITGLSGQGTRIDILVDNAGFELVCDLCLADYLLHAGGIERVQLHLKAQPTFVSDAMIKDVRRTLAWLAEDGDEASHTFAARLEEALTENRLLLREDFFWTSPLPAWQAPATLRQELQGASLIISKGDANYRRLLGDRHWAFTQPVQDVCSYLPAPLLALRSLKSEIVVGMTKAQIESAGKQDKDWMIDGKWGLIQLIVPR